MATVTVGPNASSGSGGAPDVGSATGVLAIANGGTGQDTAQEALDALLPAQTGNSGKFLTNNGTVASWGDSPTTAWVAYTPTIGAGYGTTSNVNFRSRRVGSNLEIIGYFTCGTVTAGAASISIGYNGSNANVTTASWLTQYSNVGHWAKSQNTGTTSAAPTILVAPSATVFSFSFSYDSNNAMTPQTAVNNFVDNNRNFGLRLSVPIEGW